MGQLSLRSACVMSLLFWCATPTLAQHPSAKSVVERSRRKGGENIVAVEFQHALKDPQSSRARVDSLADGMVNVSISTTDPLVESMMITVFTMAKDVDGKVFAASFDRLMYIHEHAVDERMRWAALNSLGEADIRRAIPFWREMAMRAPSRRDVMGPTIAVEGLCEQGGAAGKKVLEQLYESAAVTDPEAKSLLGLQYGSKFTIGCT
jgi:hypothetical protein